MSETKNTFVDRQRDEVKTTLESLRKHVGTIEERIIQEPDTDKLRDLLVVTEEGVDTLEPILADFEREGVDSEELVQYARIIEDWQEKEKNIADYLA